MYNRSISTDLESSPGAIRHHMNPTEPQTLTDKAVATVKDYAEILVKRALADSYAAGTDFPGFLADPADPVVPLRPVKQLVRHGCRRWARGGISSELPGFDAAWGAICDPYLTGIDENPGAGDLGKPFEGGQCPVSYSISATYSLISKTTGEVLLSGQQSDPPTPVVGPVQGFVTDVVGPDARLLVRGAGGSNVELVRSPTFNFRGDSLNLTRIDGQPDNCGGPPPLYTPPATRPGLPPLPPTVFNLPGIGPVDFDVSFDPDGNIDITFPDLGLDFKIPNPFAIQDDGTGGTGPDIAPTTPGAEGEPVDTGAGGDASGEAGEGQELSGVLVTVLGAPGSANTFDNISAQVFRGIGYVSMGYPGLLGVDTSAAVVESPQFFHAQQRGLTAWRVRANVGFSLRTTPYYREVTQ